MNKLFDRIFWHNNTTPALNESNLNSMSKAIDDIDDRVIEIASTIMETVPEILDLYEDIETLTQNPPYIGANGNWYVWNTETGSYVDSGVDASITVSIEDITMLDYVDDPYVTNSGTDTDPIFHLFIPRAATIESVEKTSTSGNVDTYTMTLQDGSEFTFIVKNGNGFGDMTQSDYDPNGDVVNAGGIPKYLYVDTAQDGEIMRFNILTRRWSGAESCAGINKLSGALQQGIRTTVFGYNSHTEGIETVASGDHSHAEGDHTCIHPNATSAHAEGMATTAEGVISHAEGSETYAVGLSSHAEGANTCSYGDYSHAEGSETLSEGDRSHSEGHQTCAIGSKSHAEGTGTCASGIAAHSEGTGTTASGAYAHAEGYETCAGGLAAHATGVKTTTANRAATAVGDRTFAGGNTSLAIGLSSYATNDYEVAIGGPVHDEGFATTMTSPNPNITDLNRKNNQYAFDGKGNLFMRGTPYLVNGYIEGRLSANGDSIVLEDGATYILYWNSRLNTGAIRGSGAYVIYSTFNPAGEGAVSAANGAAKGTAFGASGTTGVVITYGSEAYEKDNNTYYHSKIGIGSCTTACYVRYTLIKVSGSLGDFANE